MPQTTILLLEDEPLILMDLEMAAQDRDCRAITASTLETALRMLGESNERIDVAILDVSLGAGKTCEPVARELERRAIPYILHSGNLDRRDEVVRDLDAVLVPKPTRSDDVIAVALGLLRAAA